MNDEQLKKEIEQALSVAPSPQFIARVRRHIADEPRRKWTHVTWRIGTAALLASAILLGIVAIQPREARIPRPVAIEKAAPGPAPVQVVTRATLQKPVAAKKAKDARPRHAEPEVLVDPREVVAFQSLIVDLEERRIDPSQLSELFEEVEKARTLVEVAPMPLAGLEPIVIRPLTFAVPDKEGGSL